MNIQLTPYFEKQMRELPKPTRLSVIDVLESSEAAPSLSSIKHLKSLSSRKGKRYYRIRSGMYRIGFELINDVLIFRSVGTRGGFYKEFPPK